MDSLNSFFEEGGRRLSDAFGNPRADAKPILEGGNPWPHSINGTGVLGFLPIIPYSEVLNVPFKDRKVDSGLLENYVHSSKDYARTQSPGFTPVQYYKTVSPSWAKGDPEKRLQVFRNSEQPRTTRDAYNKQAGNGADKGSYELFDDKRQGDFRFSQDDESRMLFSLQDLTRSPIGPDGSIEKSSLIESIEGGDFITSFDNEDPVHFGFDIEIDIENSPLFKELDSFFSVVTDSEVSSRKEIYIEFKKELSRYFKFYFDDVRNVDSSIFGTNKYNKYYYIQKIVGLDKLSEGNTTEKQNAFTNYGSDKLSITFLEDTTLNLGTLYTLYKSLYWSRIHGKSIIPENLLRFDMKITVSELRNFVKVKKALASTNSSSLPQRQYGVEVLKANISKYVYTIYECQFFFEKPTHPNEIDLGARPSSTPTYTVDLTYKYSNMSFERYNPGSELWGIIDNKENGNGSGLLSAVSRPDVMLEEFVYLGATEKNDAISNLKINDVNNTNIYNYPYPIVVNAPGKIDTKSAGEKFLERLKTAALNEAQRQLNVRFRLLNNTLDRVRESFGIGRMPPPTNVYQIPPGGQFFYDVQNSLRGFAGDSLSGLL